MMAVSSLQDHQLPSPREHILQDKERNSGSTENQVPNSLPPPQPPPVNDAPLGNSICSDLRSDFFATLAACCDEREHLFQASAGPHPHLLRMEVLKHHALTTITTELIRISLFVPVSASLKSSMSHDILVLVKYHYA